MMRVKAKTSNLVEKSKIVSVKILLLDELCHPEISIIGVKLHLSRDNASNREGCGSGRQLDEKKRETKMRLSQIGRGKFRGSDEHTSGDSDTIACGTVGPEGSPEISRERECLEIFIGEIGALSSCWNLLICERDLVNVNVLEEIGALLGVDGI